MFFNQYPYLNLNDLNLDYILKAIGEMKYEVTNFVSINAIKYADPIQWNITSQYEKNTIVIDPVTGTAYISVAPVPAGVALTRPEYWTVVFDLGSFVTRAAQNFTSRWESDTTTTATFPTATGEWLVWGDVLYKALTNITAGDTYVVNSNIEHFTIEDLYNAYLNTVASILGMIGDLVDLNTVDKTNLVAALNEVVGNLAQEVTDRTNAILAINEKLDNLAIYNVKDYGAIGDGVEDDTQAFIDAIAAANAGEIVYIPAGTYKVANTLTINKPLTIIGSNRYDTTIKYYGNLNLFEVDAGYGFTMRNLRLDGNKTGNYGILLDGNSFYWTIDTCIIHDFNDGIHVDYAPYGCLNNSLLYNANYDVYVQNTANMDEGDSVFTNNEFLTSEYSNTHIYFASSGGDKISNNKFNGGANAVVIEFQNGIYTVDFEFTNNSIENTTAEGVKINMIGTGHVANVTIVGNQFDTYGACVLANGIVENLNISSNDMNCTSTRCVWLDNGVDNAIVQGNTLRGNAGIYTNGDGYNKDITIGLNSYNVSGNKFERASAYAAGKFEAPIVEMIHAQSTSFNFELSAYVGALVDVKIAGTIANVGAVASHYNFGILNDTGNVIIREFGRDIAANDIYHVDVPVSTGFATVEDVNNVQVSVPTSSSTMNARGTNSTNDPLAITLTNSGNVFTLNVSHASEIVDATITIKIDGFVKSF